jgi:cytochrome P450
MYISYTSLLLTQFLGKFKILKDSFVLSNLWAILHDERHFDRPEVFDPTRFLGSNLEFSSKHFACNPFGIGRRIFLGEKLALTSLFLITIRLLQSTSNY